MAIHRGGFPGFIMYSKTRRQSPAVKEQKLTNKEMRHMNQLLENMNAFMERSLTG